MEETGQLMAFKMPRNDVPGTPARGTKSPVRAFVTEFLTILK